ncbi:MAG: peptidylprolyl isomerase [Flavobacteriaceae bacterium]|nr:peptidylprolyl isomerase [Flavobacteriaceae bacterium]
MICFLAASRDFYPAKIVYFVLILFSIHSCDSEIEEGVMKSDLNKDVEMITNYGTIIMRLSDETPKHRNNFIKLVNQKFYDSLLFHRVIENFIIQTGDPESKLQNSEKELGASDLPYRIPKEINNNLFHKRGALNAAREGDDSNPEQASSSTQFTIVQGRVYNDSTLEVALGRINNWLAYNKVIHKPENKTQFEALQNIVESRDSTKTEDYNRIKKKLDSLTKLEEASITKYNYPEAHREHYKTIGGAAHLDQNYTVFGEVVKGMDIVDSIAAVEKNGSKPINDVRIITARLIKRKEY